MTDVPVWLLDVDGVLNATRPGWGAAPRKSSVWSQGDSREYVLRWAPALLDRIRTLHISGTVEVVWCTTWCDDADTLERLWRLPPLGRAFEVPPGRYVGDVKLAAARQVLADGRRLIWTDDTETPTSGDVYDELTADGRGLLIAPSPSRGLRPKHIDLIEAFCAVPDPATEGENRA